MLKRSFILLGGLFVAGMSMAAMADSCAGLNGTTWKGTFKTDVPSIATCYYKITATITGAGSAYTVHFIDDMYKSQGTKKDKCPKHNDFINNLICDNGAITTYVRSDNRDMVKATLAGNTMHGQGDFHDQIKVNYTLDLQK